MWLKAHRPVEDTSNQWRTYANLATQHHPVRAQMSVFLDGGSICACDIGDDHPSLPFCLQKVLLRVAVFFCVFPISRSAHLWAPDEVKKTNKFVKKIPPTH